MKLSNMFSTNRLWLAAGFLLIFSHCIKKTSSNEIFKDEFNRTTGFGENWTINTPGGASFGISSNRAYPIASSLVVTGLPQIIYNKKITGNFKVSSKFIISGGSYTSMAFIFGRSAATDTAADSYMCGYYYSSTLTKNIFMLGKSVSNTVNIIGEIGMHTLTSGITDTITLTFDGTSIKCEMAGNSTIGISVKDSQFGDGYAGLLGGGTSTNYIYFDDFLAEKL